jgi:hypothetical protein
VVGIVVPVLIVISLAVAYMVNRSDHPKSDLIPTTRYMRYRQVPATSM